MKRLILLCVLSLSPGASAHSFWMEVRDLTDGAREVRLFVGEQLKNPEPVEVYSPDRFNRFDAVQKSGSTTDLLLFLRPSGERAAVLPGSVKSRLLVIDTGRREVSLPPEKFREYLAQEGLTKMLAKFDAGHPDRIIEEEYFRCAKALLPPTADPSGNVTAPIGQEVEIVPLTDPHVARAKAEVRFKVLRNGAPLAGATVFSATRVEGQVQVVSAISGKDGNVGFTRPPRGDWLVSSVFMEPSPNPSFDYRSVWASVWMPLPR